MAVVQRQPKNQNFLSPVGFKFICDNIPNVEFFCQSANIPGVSVSEISVPTPFNPHYVAGDGVNYEELSIRIIVDENMKNWQEIYNWIINLGRPENLQGYAEQKKKGLNTQGVLTILTGSNTPQIEFHFKEMFPLSISGLSFDVNNTDITYLSADVTFRYNTYSIKNLLIN